MRISYCRIWCNKKEKWLFYRESKEITRSLEESRKQILSQISQMDEITGQLHEDDHTIDV